MAAIIIETNKGKIRGEAQGSVAHFQGVPYAAPPVGELRFAEPEPHAAWDGELDATKPGPSAPQRERTFPGIDVALLIGKGWERGDDYLTANIWMPEGEATARPVMVFIHGGGSQVGSNNIIVNDGSGFARAGIVCFSINYRLAVDGFLPIPGVPTNLGLRDQIAALKWVRENAAAFGGDADNITVFGESAGAFAISNLVGSPLAKGLFKRAIVQSGHGGMTRPIDVTMRLVKKLAKLMKIAPTKAGFASVGPEATFDAIDKASKPFAINLRDGAGHEPAFGISRFLPVHGDDVIPEPTHQALAKGTGAEIDVLIGTNAAEMNLYFVPTGVREKIGKWASILMLSRSQPKAWKALKAYGLGRDKAPGQALTDAMNDLVFRWGARRFAEEHQGRTHMYEFEWHSPAFDGALGACHGVELPFVFDTLPIATSPQGMVGPTPPQALADRVHGIWMQFAKDGSLPWREYTREDRQVFQLEKGEAIAEPVMPAAAFLP